MADGIDHLVIAVPDPDATAAELTDALGIAFTAGGHHEGVGTFNRITFLGGAYLELIGVDDVTRATNWPVGSATVAALRRGGGLATYALLVQDLEATVATLRASNSSIGPVVQGSRMRPDGDLVEWWAATPPALGPERPPFLIQHAYRGAEWGPAAMAARRAFVDPIGSPVELALLEIPCNEPAALAGACAEQVGLIFGDEKGRLVARTGSHLIRLVDAHHAVEGVRVVMRADEPRRETTVCNVHFVIGPSGEQ